jgi:hypothetical protein
MRAADESHQGLVACRQFISFEPSHRPCGIYDGCFSRNRIGQIAQNMAQALDAEKLARRRNQAMR